MKDTWQSFQQALIASRARRRRRRRLVLVVLGASLFGAYAAAKMALRFEDPPPRVDLAQQSPLHKAENGPDVLARLAGPAPTRAPGGGLEEMVAGNKVTYTIDPELQELAVSVLRQNRVPYGAFVAVEPATGRVLAMAEHSELEPDVRDFCRRATYPAASLIKVITSSAALEAGKVTPSSVFRFEGSPYVLYPRKISPQNARREGNSATLAEALGQSNNVVFAKVGAGLVGAERLEAKLGAYGFNREIPFDFPMQMSRATVPREEYLLARTAAGFGEVYLSPVHAALIAAAVGNGGVMMKPWVVDSIRDSEGKVLHRGSPAVLGRCVSEPVARSLAQMMQMTVARGTSTKVFARYARKLWHDVLIAGKTGSLMGDNPPGMYEWFIGFAPADAPKIAVASLVVNRELWHIKGTYVAQAVMREFFGM